MTFETALALKLKLEQEYDKTADALKHASGNERTAMGLTPDNVKRTHEWQTAYRERMNAWRKMRAFNGSFLKQFRKEYRAYRERK